MSQTDQASSRAFTGGCLCGAVRYEATGAPNFMGFCCCGDCRKASGSGAVPFIGFSAQAIRFTGETAIHVATSLNGGEAVRNTCPTCHSLVFGGRVGVDSAHTLYAGTLDDASLFEPAMAIFVRDKPDWVRLPDGLALFETMPG